MSENIFSFLRLRVGDKLILGNYAVTDYEISVIHATVTDVNSDGVHVCQTINAPDTKKHVARWLGIGRIAGNAQLYSELYLGEDVRGSSIPKGQFLVFTMEEKPYVLPLTDIEVNPREGGVAQDLTKF